MTAASAGEMVVRVEVTGYDVSVGRGLLARIGENVSRVAAAHRYALVSDGNVMPLYGDCAVRSLGADRTLSVTMGAGESNKTRDTWARATDEMLSAGLGRDTTVVALGGGVVGDLAGFIASTYMRGVPVVQVPTTLLAMVDASIGGKTGVDTVAGKNLVGTFHPPAAVLVDVTLLATLPELEFRSGLAEALKHGIIASGDHLETILGMQSPRAWQALAANDDRGDEIDPLRDLVAQSAALKAGVVRADVREQGMRKWLNFGHTIGHAVELCSGFRLLHGEAVAIGMVAEARLAELLGIAESGTAATVLAAVRWAGLPERLPRDMSPTQVVAATRSDKKARAGGVEYALPAAIGRMAGEESGWAVRVADADVLGALA